MELPVYIIDKLKPKNNGTFKLVDVADIDYNGIGLDEAIFLGEFKGDPGATIHTGKTPIDSNGLDGDLFISTDDGSYDLYKKLAGKWNKIGNIKGPPGVTKWADIIDKPVEYTPAEHKHDIVDVEGLDSALEKVLEYKSFDTFPAAGKAKTLYIDTSLDDVYRWSTELSKYIRLSRNIDNISVINGNFD